MPLRDEEKLRRLDDLKTKLFSPSYKSKIEYHANFAHKKEADVPLEWQEEEILKPSNILLKTNMFKKLFAFSLFIFLISLFYFAYVFLMGGNTVSNKNIDISIFGNTFVGAGEELSLQVEIKNKNASALQLVDMIVEYPKSYKGDTVIDFERVRESIGDISAGAIKNENISLTLFGEEGITQKIKIMIEYRIEGSNSIFVKEKTYEVTISSTPVKMSVVGPETIVSNEEVKFRVSVLLNADKSPENMFLRANYPFGFEFISSDPLPFSENNIWSLDGLKPGEEKVFNITGKMIEAFDGDEKNFQFFTGISDPSRDGSLNVVFNSFNHLISIKRPFIEAVLFVNNTDSIISAVNQNSTISAYLNWANNLDSSITNIQMKISFSGNALDQRSIDVRDGFYDSIENVIVWDKNYRPELEFAKPKDRGSFNFSFKALPIVSSSGLLEDPVIKMNVSVSAVQSLEGNLTKNIEFFDTREVRVISDLNFTSKSLYYSGPFKNTGPLPPVAERETTYTISWSVSNTSNSISNAVLKGALPPRIRFVGSVFPEDEDITFNPETREVVWKLGTIRKGVGINSLNKEVSFQVALTPSLSQISSIPTLMSGQVLTGYDDFAKVEVKVNKNNLSTNLAGDMNYDPVTSVVRDIAP